MKIYNLINKQGNAVKNQFVIHEENLIKFQSYDSLICIIDNDKKEVTLFEEWTFSPTTTKHFLQFFNDYMGYNATYQEGALKRQDIENCLKHGELINYKIKMNR